VFFAVVQVFIQYTSSVWLVAQAFHGQWFGFVCVLVQRCFLSYSILRY